MIEPFLCTDEELGEVSATCLPLLPDALFGEPLDVLSDCCILQNQIASLCTCEEVLQVRSRITEARDAHLDFVA